MASFTLVEGQNRVTFGELLHSKIVCPEGKIIGTLKDLIIESCSNPRVVACIVRNRAGATEILGWSGFTFTETSNSIRLVCRAAVAAILPSGALSLQKQLLDMQLIDESGRKRARVNDIVLCQAGEETHTVALDASVKGLLKRLGVLSTIAAFVKIFRYEIPGELIHWNRIEGFTERAFIRLGGTATEPLSAIDATTRDAISA